LIYGVQNAWFIAVPFDERVFHQIREPDACRRRKALPVYVRKENNNEIHQGTRFIGPSILISTFSLFYNHIFSINSL